MDNSHHNEVTVYNVDSKDPGYLIDANDAVVVVVDQHHLQLQMLYSIVLFLIQVHIQLVVVYRLSKKFLRFFKKNIEKIIEFSEKSRKKINKPLRLGFWNFDFVDSIEIIGFWYSWLDLTGVSSKTTPTL